MLKLLFIDNNNKMLNVQATHQSRFTINSRLKPGRIMKEGD